MNFLSVESRLFLNLKRCSRCKLVYAISNEVPFQILAIKTPRSLNIFVEGHLGCDINYTQSEENFLENIKHHYF